MDPATILAMMVVGYMLTVIVEVPTLLLGLSRRHPFRHRLFAGFWLTACTYPVVWLVLPYFFTERWLFLLVAESFAPAAECLLFWLAFSASSSASPRATVQDLAAIVLANLLSFGLGEGFNRAGGWEALALG